MNDSDFDAALETATDRTRMEHSIEDKTDIMFPHDSEDLTDFEAEMTSVVHPVFPVLRTVVSEPDADEVDGAKPRTGAKTFVWNISDDDELAFRVVAEWENTYDDTRVTVESPAPWDTPDDMTPANEVIKSMEWEDHHYTFDDDNRAAPPEASDAWTLDESGVDELRDLAEDAGYEWVDARDEENDADPMLADLLDFVRDGDRVEVTYAKKNGNGLSTYSGEVTYFTRVHTTKTTGYDMSTGDTWGLVFEDDNGKVKRVKEDDDGVASLFSNGHYPFMGNVVTVTVGSPDADFDNAEVHGANDESDAEDDENEDASASDTSQAVAAGTSANDADDGDDLPDDMALFAN